MTRPSAFRLRRRYTSLMDSAAHHFSSTRSRWRRRRRRAAGGRTRARPGPVGTSPGRWHTSRTCSSSTPPRTRRPRAVFLRDGADPSTHSEHRRYRNDRILVEMRLLNVTRLTSLHRCDCLPPFQGGLRRALRLRSRPCASSDIPARAGSTSSQFPNSRCGVYDWVISFDHATGPRVARLHRHRLGDRIARPNVPLEPIFASVLDLLALSSGG